MMCYYLNVHLQGQMVKSLHFAHAVCVWSSYWFITILTTNFLFPERRWLVIGFFSVVSVTLEVRFYVL